MPIEHHLTDLLRQRIFAQALGHEDLIDHDTLRFDPALMAALDRPKEVLAGKPTLNRLEHAGKIGLDRHYKPTTIRAPSSNCSSISSLCPPRAADPHRARPRCDR